MAGSIEIILRAITEPDYRETLFADFDHAVEGYPLEAQERASLRALSPTDFDAVVGGMLSHMLVPVRACRRVVVIPASRPDIVPGPGDVPVRLGAHMAFGNGAHQSTRAALVAMENHLRPADQVLDLGVGSGILSIAAIGLGARTVLGLDINPGAVEASRENFVLNRVEEAARAEVGSLEDVLMNRLGLPDPTFDLVVANILPHVILDFINEGIIRTLRPDARLITSGIRTANVHYITEVLPAAGLDEAARYVEGGWTALVLRRAEGRAVNDTRPMRWTRQPVSILRI